MYIHSTFVVFMRAGLFCYILRILKFSLRKIDRLEHFNLKLLCERQSVVIEELFHLLSGMLLLLLLIRADW